MVSPLREVTASKAWSGWHGSVDGTSVGAVVGSSNKLSLSSSSSPGAP